MKDFEIFNHTADTGIIAYGDSINKAFANAAKALFSLIGEFGNDTEKILHRDIVLTAPDQESLLVKWLNELIYIFDTENIIFTKFNITKLSKTYLIARSYGEKIDSSRHQLKNGVKAATYHMLKIDKINGYRVQVLFDI
ncbi:MAG: archease [Dehalococcoidales bacterium]|nr:archease [Dehalococcoidales bacterium]